MTAVLPGGLNTFVKDHKSTGGLIIDFSRNPSDFAVNKYTQIRNVTKSAGYYLKMTVEEAGRILNSDLADFVFEDGADRPVAPGTEFFEFSDYRTRRYNYSYVIGDKAVDQADWGILETHNRIKAQQAMTGRTQLANTLLTTSGNYASNHTSAVESISGNTGTWAQSTTARADIKRSLHHAANEIMKDTLGSVSPEDLVLVMGPDTAKDMALSQEIIDYIKGAPEALAQIRGEGQNAIYGLPDKLYGYEVVVDRTVKTTNAKGATKVASYVWGSGDATMIARPGDLVAASGGPSFSTVTCFAYEEMTVETLRDAQNRNRRVEGHVVDDIVYVMTAPSTGFYFSSAV